MMTLSRIFLRCDMTADGWMGRAEWTAVTAAAKGKGKRRQKERKEKERKGTKWTGGHGLRVIGQKQKSMERDKEIFEHSYNHRIWLSI